MRVGNLTYTYDNLGNIKTVKEGTELKESYVYDSLNQLVRHNSVTQNKTIVYTYDAGGNILNRKEYAYTTDADLSTATPTSTVVYTYGDSTWKDKLTAYDGQSIAYDAIGNPITYRGWSNTWQGRQLASTSQGGMTLSFKYNVDGIRTQKTVNGTATDFFLNGTKILAQKTGNTVTWFYYDQQGTRVAMEHGGKLYYYLYNLQGDVIALCDASSKQIVAKYSYDAWGKLLTKEGTLADVNPFRYRGYYYDSETGMYYLNARYYDPQTGRFLNADALLGVNEGASYNLFSYCGNNPVNRADHSGNAVGLAVAYAFMKAAFISLVVLTVYAVVSQPSVQRSIQNGIEATAKAVKTVVENGKKKLTERNHSVYVMRDKKNKRVEYVGRSVDTVRRQKQHDKDPRKDHLFPLEVKVTDLTLPEARAVEQVLISAYALENLDNARREIAVGNVAGFQENMGRIVQIFQNSTEDELLNLMGR